MNYWLISDTHFNHTKLEEWGGRSGDWQEQIYKGLGQIEPGDTLIHMGDICIGNDQEIHRKLFGHKVLSGMTGGEVWAGVKKILVKGNHDRKSDSWYLEHGWDFVVEHFSLKFHGVDILFSHRPMHPDMWRYGHNIHGHTHGNNHRAEEYFEWYDPKGYHIDISPELVGYRPLRLDTLMKKRKV